MEIYMIEWQDSKFVHEINSAIYVGKNIEEAEVNAKNLSDRKPTITHIGTANSNAVGFVMGSYNTIDY